MVLPAQCFGSISPPGLDVLIGTAGRESPTTASAESPEQGRTERNSASSSCQLRKQRLSEDEQPRSKMGYAGAKAVSWCENQAGWGTMVCVSPSPIACCKPLPRTSSRLCQLGCRPDPAEFPPDH